MAPSSADPSTILDRVLNTAADNLRIAKILVQMGLDPNNVTSDALFNRLLEIVLANITLANMFALVGRHLLCRYLADADNGATAGREYGRLYILCNLWRAFRKRRHLSALSAVAAGQCRSPPSTAQAR